MKKSNGKMKEFIQYKKINISSLFKDKPLEFQPFIITEKDKIWKINSVKDFYKWFKKI